MKQWICGLLCLCLFAAPALAEQPPQLVEPAGVQLNAVEAFTGNISKITVYPGSVVPYVQEFYFEQEGVIEEMHVIAGQLVKAGDPLITLDTEAENERLQDLQRELEQLETNSRYEEELAELDLAILAAELRALERQGDETAAALKRLDMEEKQLNMELDRKLRKLSMEQLSGERKTLEAAIEKNVLYAPFDGRVVYMSAAWQHGDYVSAFTPLIYLADDSQLFVETAYISNTTLDLAHDVYAQIGEQTYAVTPTPVDEKKYLAKVLSGESLIRQFTFDQQADQLAPGQYAAVCVEGSYRENVLLVPTNCLYSADRTRYLYVMENGVRVRRDVQVGVSTDWYTQITEGLQEGELVYVKE